MELSAETQAQTLAPASEAHPKLFDSDAYARGFREGLKPDRVLSLVEWSDRYRYLSTKSSAEPGKYRTSRIPYIREVMDCLSTHSPHETVVMMFGAQLGKTETGLCWLGYIADTAPSPVMIVQPSLDLAKRFSKQRLDPLFEDTPRLKGKLKPARERDSGNSQLAKVFDGGLFIISGSNSPASLRSAPVRFLMLDETDAYGLTDEGSPIELALARTKTFARRKILMTSTPTLAGQSAIEQAYFSGDQRKYHVPCPHCGEYQELTWSAVKWEDKRPETAHFVCKANACRIEDHHKTQMLERGKWVSTSPGDHDPKVASFHLSSLYAPAGWFSLSDAVKMFLRAQKDKEQLRTFINTYLAETWRTTEGDAPAWEKLYRRREKYRVGLVPRGPVFLTAGVDVQKDRLEYEVTGWGPDKQSWSIEYGALNGDTSSPDSPVWRDLDKLLTREWEGEDGKRFGLRLLAIDTGYNTQVVYNWARKYPSNRVVAIKGSDTLATIVGMPKSVDVTLGGKSIRRGLRLWSVGVSIAKTELYGWLNLDPPLREGDAFPAGYCHFPEYDEEYFKMLTAEVLTARYHKGFRRYEFEKIRERNEALDARVYARACAAIIGMDRMSENAWRALDVNHNGLWPDEDTREDAPEGVALPTSAQTPPTGGTPQAPPPAPRPRSEILAGRRRSSFW